MHTAYLKHALSAGLMAALLGMSVLPAAALAGDTTGSSDTAGSDATGGAGVASGDATSPSTTGEPAAPTPTRSSKRTLATWYGPGFYGHETACGQKLTPKLVGVASRTLPCGTLVQISYRGHQLTAPVLDRGPFGHNGAVWDLTSGAARALQITETVRIATQVVGTLPDGPTLGEPSLSGATSPAAATGPLTGTPSTTQAAATGGATAS